ncbi:hypothetical protein DSECCO2_346150 [anaerobic digester metagenome]
MLFLEMVNELQKSYEIAISDFDNQTLIFDVVLLTNSQVDWFSNTLYIGSVPQIDYPLELPIVILSPDCEDFENRLSPGSCWGIIKSESLNEIYYMAKEILYENLKFQAISFQVAQAVLESKNIVSLMNKVAALMGNALILIDSNMKVLAYSTIYEIMDPLWLENIKQGHYSYDFTRIIHKPGQFVKKHHTKAIFRLMHPENMKRHNDNRILSDLLNKQIKNQLKRVDESPGLCFFI